MSSILLYNIPCSWPSSCLGLYALLYYHLLEGRVIHFSNIYKVLPPPPCIRCCIRHWGYTTRPCLQKWESIHVVGYYAVITKNEEALCVKALEISQDTLLSDKSKMQNTLYTMSTFVWNRRRRLDFFCVLLPVKMKESFLLFFDDYLFLKFIFYQRIIALQNFAVFYCGWFMLRFDWKTHFLSIWSLQFRHTITMLR